jgi:preprotein translocase SecE subunit
MEAYKSGQGSFARLSVNVAVLLALFLGCMELYSWIQDPADTALVPGAVFSDLPLLGAPLSWKFLLCVGLFIGLWMLIRKWITKPAAVDALIETELEMKKVSWPTAPEARTATWVVIFVTVLLTLSLAFFDIALVSVFNFVFAVGPN